MTETSKLTMIFILDNDEEFKYNLSSPKEDLTKAQVDVVMQKMIDSNAILKDGHAAVSIKESYITTTNKNILA